MIGLGSLMVIRRRRDVGESGLETGGRLGDLSPFGQIFGQLSCLGLLFLDYKKNW